MGNCREAQERGIRNDLFIGLESWLGDFGEDTGREGLLSVGCCQKVGIIL